MSKDNDVLNALRTQVKAYFVANPLPAGDIVIERNTDFPEEIPSDGLIIIRDGDPGAPDICTGQPGPAIYDHHVEIEIAVQNGDPDTRDNKYAALKAALGAAIETDKTFGGAAYGCLYGNPKIEIIPILGAPGIKAGIIELVVTYAADTPLA